MLVPEQVKRNKNRFPENFMFQLSEKEVEDMVSQNVIPAAVKQGFERVSQRAGGFW